MQPNDSISREEARKLSEIFNIEDRHIFVQKLYEMPTITDNSSQIREMIEKKIKYYKERPKYIYGSKAGGIALQELLAEIDSLTA